MATITEVESRIDSHIDICAVRYEGLEKQFQAVNARLKRVETILIGVAGTIILLLLKIAFHV